VFRLEVAAHDVAQTLGAGEVRVHARHHLALVPRALAAHGDACDAMVQEFVWGQLGG
jgi:hypothetical protein